MKDEMFEIFEKAAIMKKNMIKKGLTAAKAKCPYCEGEWRAVLAGPKKHMHMRCTKCGIMVME